MADKGAPDDGPSLEMPSLPFGRRKRRAEAEADAPAPDSPAAAPSPPEQDRSTTAAQAPSATASSTQPVEPAAPARGAAPVQTAPTLPAKQTAPAAPAQKTEPPRPATPPAEVAPPVQKTQPTRPVQKTAPAPPVQKTQPVRSAPATPPVASAGPAQETQALPTATTSTPRPAPAPGRTSGHVPGPTTPLAGDVDDPRSRRAPQLPALSGVAAALATGAAIGGLGVLLVWLASRGCEAARGTASCGDGPGFLVLLAILAALAYVGGMLLRAFGVPDAGSTSLLAVGVMAVLLLVFFTDAIFSWWMAIVVPLVAALAYALSWWVTTRVVQNDDEPAPTRL